MNLFKDKNRLNSLLTCIKFLLALVLSILTISTTKNPLYFFVGLVELALIFVIYNLLVEKNIFAWLFANLLFFIYVAQMVVLYFGNSFVTLTMLKNIKFLEDLGGKVFVYILGVVLALAIVFIRGNSLTKHVNYKILIILLFLLLSAEIGFHFESKRFSPVQSFATVFVDHFRYQNVKKALGDPSVALSTYYKDGLADAVAKPENLPDNPNVILIFTEGLSYNIISDERNIMPNLKALEKESLAFSNYYNHTFPTLRGVQGQLYSGYKLDDDEKGNNLISLQDILKDNGYSTSFIDTEPFNEEFSSYCQNLGFDGVVTDPEQLSGYNMSMNDSEAYNFLFDYASDLSKDENPFFISMYTFGTHVSFDSPDEVFGDGKNSVLNRFYYLDCQIGKFIDAFNSSALSDNTILVFTTDHCTYSDQDYTNAFPNYLRECTDADEIPLFIYYKGVTPSVVDVNGRNSLCLAPTVLDYLDIDHENYFLGTSLFDADASSEFDTVFYDASYLVSTKDSMVRYMSDLEIEEFLSQVLSYYSALEADR